MATYDAADCLARFNETALRPTADEISDASKYRWLTRAQNKVIADIAARAPWTLYGAPTAMTTADGGFTYQFGTDSNGYPVTPIGKCRIYTSLTAIPQYPWQEGYDYLNEGEQIRIPNNRTYTGTLYYRGINQPADIDATHQPALLPEASRELIVIEAVRDFASQGSRLPQLAVDKQAEYDREFARWMLVWKTQFSSGGALAAFQYDAADLTGGYLGGLIVSP